MTLKDLNGSRMMFDVYISYLEHERKHLERIMNLMVFHIKVKQIANLFNAKETLKELIRELKEIRIIKFGVN